MTRRLLLPVSVAVLATGIAAAPLVLRPRHYPGTVIHVHISADSQPPIGPIDFWFDPQAHFWRTTIAATRLDMYVHCPGTAPCRMVQSPDFRAVTPDTATTWRQLVSTNLDSIPPNHLKASMVLLGGKAYRYYAVTLQHIAAVQRQYWVDPSSGTIVRYRELVAGQVVISERRTQEVLPSGSLPENFFQPPPPGGDWKARLQGWLQARLSLRR